MNRKERSDLSEKSSVILEPEILIEEIKTLKAMIDDVKEKDCMIFIDEILRGTNEKERVMISQAILTYLF